MNVCTKTHQLLHVHEAVFKNRLADHRGASGLGHKAHELGLQVGREAGVGIGFHIHWLKPMAIALNAQTLIAALNHDAGPVQHIDH